MAVLEYTLQEPSTAEALRQKVAAIVAAGGGTLEVKGTLIPNDFSVRRGQKTTREFTLHVYGIPSLTPDGLFIEAQDAATHEWLSLSAGENGIVILVVS